MESRVTWVAGPEGAARSPDAEPAVMLKGTVAFHG